MVSIVSNSLVACQAPISAQPGRRCNSWCRRVGCAEHLRNSWQTRRKLGRVCDTVSISLHTLLEDSLLFTQCLCVYSFFFNTVMFF